MSPQSNITVFHFYADSFEELPAKMKENVGYTVKPVDIWSINIEQHELRRIRVTLTIIYWTADRAKDRAAKEM